MIDLDTLKSTLVQIAREPTYSPALSTVSGKAAVYQVRPNSIQLPYPFIVLDVLSIEQENGWLWHDGYDEDNKPYYETHYFVLCSYRAYGTGSIAIANQLEGWFRREGTLNKLEVDAGAVVIETGMIVNLPVLIEDKFVESASFTITLGVTDRHVDATPVELIETIDTTGSELYRETGDVNPLEVDEVFVSGFENLVTVDGDIFVDAEGNNFNVKKVG